MRRIQRQTLFFRSPTSCKPANANLFPTVVRKYVCVRRLTYCPPFTSFFGKKTLSVNFSRNFLCLKQTGNKVPFSENLRRLGSVSESFHPITNGTCTTKVMTSPRYHQDQSCCLATTLPKAAGSIQFRPKVVLVSHERFDKIFS